MGSEAIHYEALRKQIISDRRTANQAIREVAIKITCKAVL